MSDELATSTLALDFDLGPKAVSALHEALLERRGDGLQVDGSQVAQIGGGCLQLLLSAQMSWALDGKPFHVTSPSTELADALANTGLAETFSNGTGAIA